MYRSGGKRYIEFSRQYGLPSFPATERVLSLFVAKMCRGGMSAGTVKSYLSAVRFTQIAMGLGDPQVGSMSQLEYVLKGLKRKTSGTGTRTRRLITLAGSGEPVRCCHVVGSSLHVLLRLSTVWGGSSAIGKHDVGNPQYLEVRIKVSKTDSFRKGVTVYLGRTEQEVCPVAAILGYMVRRGQANGPFFKFSDGRYLTRARFVDQVRSALSQAGLTAGEFAGHSFRIGAATAAATQGLPEALIKTLGR